jgi:hypothetical protein
MLVDGARAGPHGFEKSQLNKGVKRWAAADVVRSGMCV